MRQDALVKRCIITLMAIAIAFVLPLLVKLPHLDVRQAYVFPQSTWQWATGSVFSLGITSFLVSAVVVDVCRRAVPAFVRSSNAGRQRWTKAVLLLAMLFSALLAYHVIRSVDAMVPLSRETKASWFVALIAGQGVLATLAWWVSRRGIGHGFAVFAALGIASELQDVVMTMRGKPAPSLADGVQMVGVPLAIAIITVWVLGRHTSAPRSWTARVPASGIGPVVLAFVLPMLVTALALFGVVDARAAAAMTPGSVTFTVIASLFTIVLSVALGYANHSVVMGAEPPLRTAFWRSMPATLLFLLVFVWRPALVGQAVVDPLSVVIATAVCMDLVAEIRARAAFGDLVVITSAVDVAAADLDALRLRRAELVVFQRGVFFATMTRFFGLLVPIEMMVPADQALPSLAEA
ncbi:MAG: hypothetical protein IPM54_08610 [Polyangiaceae bacterium]|nr:hypothetical protein [Polyangiaceae bacterium]